MGFPFHCPGCVKFAEEDWDESRAIKPNRSPPRAAQAKEKPAGVNPRDLSLRCGRRFSKKNPPLATGPVREKTLSKVSQSAEALCVEIHTRRGNQPLFNHRALSWCPWGFGLTMSKRQFERLDGAIRCSTPGWKPRADSTAQAATSPRSGKMARSGGL
jgi:hypothetical protein